MKINLFTQRMLTVAVPILSGLLFVSAAHAQNTFQPSGSNEVEEAAFLQDRANDPIKTFRGWSQLYKGYDKSPILFDSIRDGKTRKYPSLADDRKAGDDATKRGNIQAASLKRLNLGVDDEVSKATMAQYISLREMTRDWAGDRHSRDRHLGLFETLRGVAILTLSYLDKTVAAGLATVQQQADNNLSNQILKQISWTQNRLANPQRTMLYNDVDDKLEACLLHGGTTVNLLTNRRVSFPEAGLLTGTCPTKCLAQSIVAGVAQPVPPPTSMGNGLYEYCVCCAESYEQVNSTTEDPDIGLTGITSLVDRIFYGSKKPTALGGGPRDKADYVKRIVASFREMYGDIILSPCQRYPFDSGAGVAPSAPALDGLECTPGRLKTEYEFPYYSAADKINFFRDGSSCPQIGCPLTGVEIKEGICPAIREILTMWPIDTGENARARELWVQASLGRLLTADHFEAMYKKMGRISGELDAQGATVNTFTPQGNFYRWLESFCDSSAVAGFKRYHYRMMAIVEDHLRLNTLVTDYEKGMMRDLMSRITTDIELAERDYQANEVADRHLAGIAIEGDEETVAGMAASVEANRAQADASRQEGGTTTWGGPGRFIDSALTPSVSTTTVITLPGGGTTTVP